MDTWLRSAACSTLFAIILAASVASLIAQQSPGGPSANHDRGETESLAAVKTRLNPKDGAVMVFIPAGTFLMGDDCQQDNPLHTANLAGYWIYKDLVTVGMYRKYCRATGKRMPPAPNFHASWCNGEAGQDDHPIVNVNWYESEAYCKWAGAALPTEVQWEKAARGIDGRKYPWGNTFDRNKVWASWSKTRDFNGTHPVGKLGVSPYGCTDMAGNVSQWCADRYLFSKDFVPLSAGGSAGGPCRVVRGGSWADYYSGDFLASFRQSYPAGWHSDTYGFRCAMKQ